MWLWTGSQTQKHRFIHGHNGYGKKRSDEIRKRMSKA